MDKLFAKLKEYLHMDEEISFEEFNAYYKSLITELNSGFDGFDQKELITAKYICMIVNSNAESRSKRSKLNAKAFKKMAAKCAFWADAINYRLLKQGMSSSAIDEAMESLNAAI